MFLKSFDVNRVFLVLALLTFVHSIKADETQKPLGYFTITEEYGESPAQIETGILNRDSMAEKLHQTSLASSKATLKFSDESQEFSDTSSSSNSSDMPVALSDDVDGNDDMELTQIFTFTRHGISTSGFFLYNKEYSPYKVVNQHNSIEIITPLGKAQCWAAGRNFAIKHGDFIDEAVLDDSWLITIAKLDKSAQCADYFWFGVQNFTPRIGIFSDDIVPDAMKKKGNCPNCSEKSRFPYDATQLLSDGVDNEKYAPENVDVKKKKFIGLGDYCKTGRKFFDADIDPLPLEDVAVLKYTCHFFVTSGYSNYIAMNALAKHVYHGLPMSNGLQGLSKGTVNRALKMKDNVVDLSMREILNVHKSSWTIPALYARELMQDMLKKIRAKELSLAMYIVHDMNIVSLLEFFHGAKDDIGKFIPYYGSTIEVRIYYQASTDKRLVSLVYNGENYDIRACEDPCPLEQFEVLMEEYIELGGDLRDFCATNEKLTGEKATSFSDEVSDPYQEE